MKVISVGSQGLNKLCIRGQFYMYIFWHYYDNWWIAMEQITNISFHGTQQNTSPRILNNYKNCDIFQRNGLRAELRAGLSMWRTYKMHGICGLATISFLRNLQFKRHKLKRSNRFNLLNQFNNLFCFWEKCLTTHTKHIYTVIQYNYNIRKALETTSNYFRLKLKRHLNKQAT